MTVSASTLSSEGSVQAYLARHSLRRFKSYAADFSPQPWNLKLLKSCEPCPLGQILLMSLAEKGAERNSPVA